MSIAFFCLCDEDVVLGTHLSLHIMLMHFLTDYILKRVLLVVYLASDS